MKRKVVLILVLGLICVSLTGCSLLDLFNVGGTTNYRDCSVGETFVYDELEIMVSSYQIRNYAVGGSYAADSGNVWLLVYAKIYNPTTNNKELFGFGLKYTTKIVFINDKNEEVTYNASFVMRDEFIESYDNVLPYGTVEGMFAYQIPKGLVDIVFGPDYSIGGIHSKSLNKGLIFQFSLNKTNTTDVVRVKL